jgi:uncharacterized protein
MIDYIILASTLIAGLIIGYLSQRSRMCFIGGMRDYVLVKDSHLLKAILSFFAGAFVVFAISYLFINVPKWPWFLTGGFNPIAGAPLSTIASTPLVVHVFLAVLGGLGLGFFSVFAGGCPLRQHVMASEGDKSSIAYLVGFYVAAVVFTAVILPFIIGVLG